VITAIVGGQFGSEGKGAIAAAIAKDYDMHVRVGAANAGHTVYTKTGIVNPGSGHGMEKHVMQQLPCAAYTNPDAQLLLGPGALISPDILHREIERNEAWRDAHMLPKLELWVDPRAHVICSHHIKKEAETDLAARIGSTSTIAREGIGAATAARVMREAECCTAEEFAPHLRAMPSLGYATVIVDDTVSTLHLLKKDHTILLEGTQGTGLSLTTGFAPFTTSRNTTAAGLAADCGLGPGDIDRSIIVMRTYPIRVAGNSGPFYPDSEETSFDAIGVEPERTTVTKLERRIATWSRQQALEAVWLNKAPQTEIALTFADYVAPALFGETDLASADTPELESIRRFFTDIGLATGVPITRLGTGPHSVIYTGDPLSIESAPVAP
jgi:adenylosuccinate synthase